MSTPLDIDTIQIQDIILQLEQASSLESLETIFGEYFGKKGSISRLFSTLKDLEPQQKKEVWQKLSHMKTTITSVYKQRKTKLEVEALDGSLKNDIIDFSITGPQAPIGHLSLLAKTRRFVEDICIQMWLRIEYWHEVVTKYENFEAVNIPLTHPATDMQDTFHLFQKDERWESLVFRAHTSALQNELLKKYWAPLKAIVPGKVYRYENMDASHDCMFYQVEWIVIDENISIAHFKDFITTLLSTIFWTPVTIRMRPSYFPFVEPWFEIDASCPVCWGTWKRQWQDSCSLCKSTWWIEILWAGMIHPNVLREWGIDPEKYSWFAFWVWINRLVAIKYTLHDIRLLTNGDLRFIRSFA